MTATLEDEVDRLAAERDAAGRCEYCGAEGGFDMTRPPTAYRKGGRRNQGAMSAQWAPATYSPTLKAVACPPCFKPRFYRRPK